MHTTIPILNIRLSHEATGRLWVVLVLFAIALVLAALWHWTPLGDYAEPERVAAVMQRINDTWWAPLAVVGIYVVSVLVLFPITILTLATAMAFGAVKGFVITIAAALCAAAFGYGIGHAAGRNVMARHGGRVMRQVRKLAGSSGVLGMTLVHMVPIAPFSVVNMMLGALPAPFRAFMIGTCLALLPGALIRSLIGDAIMQAWRKPDRESVLYIVLGLAAWLAVIAASHAFGVYARKKRA